MNTTDKKSDWDSIRNDLLQKIKDNRWVDGSDCRKCVWANTESYKILCTKACGKKGGKV